MRLAPLALALLAVGCGSDPSSVGPPPCKRTPGEIACLEKVWIMVSVDEGLECLPRLSVTDPEGPENCDARGGERVYTAGYYSGCLENTTDAGCPCTDSDQCFGYCEAPESAEDGDRAVGTCSKRTAEECYRPVWDGEVVGWLCL